MKIPQHTVNNVLEQVTDLSIFLQSVKMPKLFRFYKTDDKLKS